MLKRLFAVATTLALVPYNIYASDLVGIVTDGTSGEPLVGATIQVKGSDKLHTVSGLDGSFEIKGLPEKGKVTLILSYVTYKTEEITVDVKDIKRLNVSLKEAGRELKGVEVTGFHNNRTDQSAIAMVKNAPQVVNVMSAQSIQLSPDVNVAASLQRMSGVTMEKDASGEASYAILRGMDKRYNYTLVNGAKISSPDDKNRYIPLNIFPNDLMDRLVVSKSLTADMEGDAAGGVIDMQMKDAPAKFQIQANAAIGSSDYFWGDRSYLTTDRSNSTSKAPYELYGSDYKATMTDFKDGASIVKSHSMPAPNFIGGLCIGDRFWDNKLGILVAGSIQNTFRGTERTLNLTDMSYGERAESIYKLDTRHYSIHDLQSGIHAKIDLNLGNHKIEWFNMYVNTVETGVRYSNSIITSYGYEKEKGNYTQDDEIRSSRQTQSVFATHLKGTHNFTENFTVDWSGIFSQAKENDPDKTYITIKNTVENEAIVKTVPSSMERRFQHNNDKDWTGNINLTYTSNFNAFDAIWKAGAMYRKKERENRYYSYQFNPNDISATLDGNGFENYYGIDWYCRTPYAQASQLNYNSKEHIGGSYAMATLTSKWGELNVGFRAEHTNQIYTMLQTFKGMGQVGEQSYWDYLPSASLKYKPMKDMNIRLSYYKSINRPGFYEIVPYEIAGEEYSEKGNPNLKRARIDNIDLRWEYFPSANEQILVGFFYKYLKDPIEQSFYCSDGRNSYYMPQNLGNAKNFGFEIDAVKYIRHFGVKANYTYTHSSITTTKRQYKLGSAETETVDQTRPLVNQAPHTANLSLLYKDTEHGWNAQLAGTFTGHRIAIVSPYKDADEWENNAISLDLSAEKKFSNGISIFLKANNLTDTKRERYLKTTNEYNQQFDGQKSDRTIVGTYKYGRTFLLGIRYTL